MRVLLLLLLILSPLSQLAAGDDIESILKKAEQLEKRNVAVFKKISESFIFIGGGSAVCISADGYILTNQHVCVGSDTWTVYDVKGKNYVANVIGRDTNGDIALLKIVNVKNMPYAKFADDDSTRIGQEALAVGDPFKLGMRDFIPSISKGIISGEHLYMDGGISFTYSDAVQTDAAVNPGNSGGPLFNSRGQIVGINGQIRHNGIRANRGIGLAISSDRIKRYLPALKRAKGGIVLHGHITGISIRELDTEKEKGLKILSVYKGSLADRKGLKAGDFVTHIDGDQVNSMSQFRNRLVAKIPNTMIVIQVLREGQIKSLHYKLDALPSPPKHFAANFRPRGLPAIRGGAISLRTGFKLIANKNKIKEVAQGSPAHAAGLLAGDVILSVNGKDKNISDVIKKLKKWPATEYLLNKIRYANIKVSRKIKGSELTYEFLTTLQLDILY
jgi:serine protease Do